MVIAELVVPPETVMMIKETLVVSPKAVMMEILQIKNSSATLSWMYLRGMEHHLRGWWYFGGNDGGSRIYS